MSSKRQRESEGLPPPSKIKPHMNGDWGSGTDHSMQEEAKIVVGIDFGTTFSGFAYARMNDPEKVFTFYDWPSQAAAGAKPYCKTQTSLWYLRKPKSTNFEVQGWGWPARVNFSKALQAQNGFSKSTSTTGSRSDLHPICGHLLTKFKLNLAAVESDSDPQSVCPRLPEGLSAERVISDYLSQLSTFIMAELRNKFGSYTVKKDVQWCLTVPAIWSDAAKQVMVNCSQMAGLVQGRHCTEKDASAHPIIIVLEPEAASVYCLHKLKDDHFKKGSKFLVVDAGGGTVDLVVHEKADDSGVRVKEVACSTGDLCGGTFVDKAFIDYLARKIGCFEKFRYEYPATVLTIQGYWENFKCSFDGQPDSYDMELPAKLASMWEAYDMTSGIHSASSHYDEVEITGEDMKMIFDGEVDKILKLIKDQLELVPGVEAIMVVGGFSNSPYLMKRIRETFSSAVKHIVSPTDPGSAVCQGAVAFGALGPDIMLSRKSRRTYGISSCRAFKKGDPTSSTIFNDYGKALCDSAFYVFTRTGDDVPVNHSVTHSFTPVHKAATSIMFSMYSTVDSQPEYITDPGVIMVSSWSYPLPLEAQKMQDKPSVEVTMYFGRTRVEMFAKPENFSGEKVALCTVIFERDIF